MNVAALLAAAAITVSTGLAAAPTLTSTDAVCTWRFAAVRLLQELDGEQSLYARQVRRLLTDFGVGRPTFLPAECRAPNPAKPRGPRPLPHPIEPRPIEPRPGAPIAPPPGAGASTSAAEKYGWGQPNRVDEFDSPASAGDWNIYDGPGHAGNGRRTPDAVNISDGVLTITGSPDGDTAGMAWNPGQKSGRWEGRVKAPASDESYNALLLLWPDAENFPVGGEIDFMEMMDHTRQTTSMFLHYGADNSQVSGEVNIDATQWHNWALEWTPTKMTAFVDGHEWWSSTDADIFPPGPMHLCIQLDWFPGDGNGDVQPSAMHVDWVKQYPLDADSPSTS